MITTAQIMGWLAENHLAPVPVDFTWQADDPWAVTLTFGSNVVWTIALELLSDGLSTHAGEGDVRLWPDHTGPQPTLLLHLRAPSGNALVALPLGEVQRFVDNAEILAGQLPEVSLDHELARLLEGA